MPDVSHGREVFRCSQARVLIARGIHSLEEISIGISYRGDLLSGLAVALIICSLNSSLCASCSIRISLPFSPIRFRPYGRPRLLIA